MIDRDREHGFGEALVSNDTVEPRSPLVKVFSQTTVVSELAVDEATWVQPDTPVGPDQLTTFARVNTGPPGRLRTRSVGLRPT